MENVENKSFIGEAKSIAEGSFFENLLPDYIKRRETDIVTLENALNDGDFKKIAQICHMIRGNATTFGFPGLTEMCRNAETAADKSDVNEVKRVLSLMRNLSLWSAA
jgi:HPt (histidine-containing phosphotransfer) domain-containing protein